MGDLQLCREAIAQALPPEVDTESKREYFGSMRVKTSITLDSDLLAGIDRLAEGKQARSRVIERALLEFLERHQRQARERRDAEILARNADELNREAEDTLEYQADL